MSYELYYLIISEELGVTIHYPYNYYNDILRYYNISDRLHTHECIKEHHTLTII